jgi:hypothetical protein
MLDSFATCSMVAKDKPESCQDETRDQLHSLCASKVVFAQEGPFLYTYMKRIEFNRAQIGTNTYSI